MLIAFNTALVPGWDLAFLPGKAAALGYDGVEAHLPNAASDDPAAGSVVAERELVHLAFEQAGVRLTGLSTGIGFDDDNQYDAKAVAAVRRVIDLAARLRCPLVRVWDTRVRPGRDIATATLRLADKLLPLADHAAETGTTIVLQNAISLHRSTAIWRLIEQMNHPAVGCAWDPLSPAVAGEDPLVAIPLLNSRIQQVLFRDATLTTGQGPGTRRTVAQMKPIGQGDLRLQRTVDRFRGIGFPGPVVVTYPTAIPPDSAEMLLQHSAEQLKSWTCKPNRGSTAKNTAPARG